MKKGMKGFCKIFAFTWRHQLTSSGYKLGTILLALLCFLLPAVLLPLITSLNAEPEPEGTNEIGIESESTVEIEEEGNKITHVYAVDLTTTPVKSYEVLKELDAAYADVEYNSCATLEEAQKQASTQPNSLILVAEKNKQTGLIINVLKPEESNVTWSELFEYESFLMANYQALLMEQMKLDPMKLVDTLMPIETVYENAKAPTHIDPETDMDMVKMVLGMVLPFLNIMLIYFMVLIYGQGVANKVLMEKSSKLMDTMLVSVDPKALVFGKVLSTALASCLQFIVWFAALIGGACAGVLICKELEIGGIEEVLLFLKQLDIMSKIESIPAILVGFVIIFLGFLLYCALASIGGALAGKQEDLSNTNAIFAMTLVISFLITLYAGGIGELSEVSVAADAINWIPFTSILIVPSRLILGEVSVWQGVLSAVIILVTDFVFMAIAGKIYRMMALFKGNPPSPIKLVKMLRNK